MQMVDENVAIGNFISAAEAHVKAIADAIANENRKEGFAFYGDLLGMRQACVLIADNPPAARGIVWTTDEEQRTEAVASGKEIKRLAELRIKIAEGAIVNVEKALRAVGWLA